jgi:uncharacterized membrane protein
VIRSSSADSHGEPPDVPAGAVAVRARHSGYLQAVDVRRLLTATTHRGVTVRLRCKVGEHVVAGTILGWVWSDASGGSAPDERAVTAMVDRTVRIGFERTLEQDPGFGFRQLVDVACKALSPAVNDPYTAIQAIEHLSVLFSALAAGPIGHHVACDRNGTARIIVPVRTFPEHLTLGLGLIRRYGAGEPTVVQALLRLLESCATATLDEPERWSTIRTEAELLVADAERKVGQAADLAIVHVEADALGRMLATRSTW